MDSGHRIVGPGFDFLARPGESVLDAGRRQGVPLPFGCRAGHCHRCLMRCLAGELPPASQALMGEPAVARGLFLACRGQPTGDLKIAPVQAEDLTGLLRIDAVLDEVPSPRIKLRPLSPTRRWREGERAELVLAGSLRLPGQIEIDPDDVVLVTLRLDPGRAAPPDDRWRGLASALVGLERTGE